MIPAGFDRRPGSRGPAVPGLAYAAIRAVRRQNEAGTAEQAASRMDGYDSPAGPTAPRGTALAATALRAVNARMSWVPWAAVLRCPCPTDRRGGARAGGNASPWHPTTSLPGLALRRTQ